MMPALESCLHQDVKTEVVVVDDASTVPLTNECKTLMSEHGNVRYIKHWKNVGLSAARNTGITNATYDKVIPLDADDHLFPNVLGKLSSSMDSSDADVTYGNLWTLGHMDYPCVQPWTKNLLRKMNPIFCSSLIKKVIWDKVGGYLVREGPHYEDWQFWNRCFMAGAKFVYVDTIVYEHVERGDSMLRKLGLECDKYVKIATECLGA